MKNLIQQHEDGIAEKDERAWRIDAVAEIKLLRDALQFYADKSHFVLSDDRVWDTVSGEPQNYWCDEAGTATVEDGTVARAALTGAPEAPAATPAYTKEQMRDRFLQHVRGMAYYWGTLKGPQTALDRCEGVAFSLLVAFDGQTMNLPAMNISMSPHEDDKQYNIKNGEQWVEPGMVINDDCMLHDLFYEPGKAQAMRDLLLRPHPLDDDEVRDVYTDIFQRLPMAPDMEFAYRLQQKLLRD